MSDHVTMGSVSIPDQWFIRAHKLDRFTAFEWGDIEWDGILGLAPSSEQSVAGIENPLQSLVAQERLDRDMFAMRLPRGDQAGELFLGGTNPELFTGDTTQLRLTHKTTRKSEAFNSPTGRWQVSLDSISIGNGAVTLKNYVALLETDYPLIALPSEMVENIHYHLGFVFAGGLDAPLSIDCEMRTTLPDITFKLDGNDFILTPFDYTLEVDNAEVGGLRCLSLFAPKPQSDADNIIILGGAFLRNWYSVFDISSGTIGLAALSKMKAKSRVGELFEDYLT